MLTTSSKASEAGTGHWRCVYWKKNNYEYLKVLFLWEAEALEIWKIDAGSMKHVTEESCLLSRYRSSFLDKASDEHDWCCCIYAFLIVRTKSHRCSQWFLENKGNPQQLLMEWRNLASIKLFVWTEKKMSFSGFHKKRFLCEGGTGSTLYVID